MKIPDNPHSRLECDAVSDTTPPGETIRLLEQARAGDGIALDALFTRYLLPLRRWARGRLPRYARDMADTQDLVQETLLQTFKNIEGFEAARAGALQGYLRQALMNRIRDELRRFGRRGASAVLDPAAPADGPSPLEHAIGQQALARYEAALARLRPDEREAIVARVEMGMSYDEMAEALQKPSADAARKAAQRALLKLAADMKHERT